MIANTWYCIAKTSTFDTGCTINVAFDGYDIQFSASVKFGMSAINITRCNIPYDTVFSLRLREGASQWFVDIFCNKEITPNVTIADSPYWAKVSTTAGEGNVILVLNDISSKYNTEQGGGTGGLDIDQLKSYLDDNGYTEAKNFWSKEGDETIRTRHNIVVDKGGAFGRGSETNITFGRLDNWEDWDASTMMFYTLSASLGVNLNERLKYIEQNGSGLNEDDLRQYLTSNNYLQEADIADLRVTVKGLDDILNGNVGGVIDSWNEVVAFLDGYSQSDDLAAILSGMNEDISNRVLTTDFEKANDSIKDLLSYFDANGNANNALKLGGQLPSYYATADALNTHITAFNTYKTTTDDRLNKLEALWFIDEDGNVHTTHNIVVEGGGAFGMGAESGGDVGGLGKVTIYLEGSNIPYETNSNGEVTIPAYPTALKNPYALTINGHTYDGSEAVNITISAGGGVADSVAWNNVTGKPTTLGGYGITDALPLSGGTITGLVTFANNEISLNGVNLSYSNSALGITTVHGSSYFGMMNESFCHIYTHAPAFYMDKPLYVDNGNSVYHTGNFNPNNYLSKSGGSIEGGYGFLQIKSAADGKISLNNTDSDNKYQFIEFLQNDARYGYLGTLGNDDLYWSGNVIIHSGNIGSQSVNYANSAGDVAAKYDSWDSGWGISNLSVFYDWNVTQSLSSYFYGLKLSAPDANYKMAIANGVWLNGLSWRKMEEGNWTTDWRTLIDSYNISDYNAGSATKLQTGRYLWGNYFNGENDVNGKPFFKTSSADTSINVDIASIIVGPATSNRSGYSSGVGFNGLLGYGGYDNHLHGWIGLNGYYSGKGAETYALVFAVNDNTTYGSVPTERMRIVPNGNVLIGTTTDNGHKLQVAGALSLDNVVLANTNSALLVQTPSGNSWFGMMNTSYCHIYTDAYQFYMDKGLNAATLYSRGDLEAAGNLTVTGGGAFGSDVRYKDIISFQQLDLETIVKAPLFSFRWNDREDKATHLGTSAQYWLDTQFKDAVNTSNKDFYHLDYGALAVGIGISVGREVKGVKTEVQLLREKVNQLEQELAQYRRA